MGAETHGNCQLSQKRPVAGGGKTSGKQVGDLYINIFECAIRCVCKDAAMGLQSRAVFCPVEKGDGGQVSPSRLLSQDSEKPGLLLQEGLSIVRT